MEIFEPLTQSMQEEFEKIGLYMRGVHVHGQALSDEVQESIMAGEIDEKQAIQSGAADFTAIAEFEIGNVAWSQRVLDPKGFAQKKEFEDIVPDEYDEETKLAMLKAIMSDDDDAI